ncbi:MAG: chemotaxis protein CheW [Myxococcales bacterium]|nr:chemotaxis protein CheW [Myxococcales bacterium]
MSTDAPQSHLVFACGQSWYAVPAERAAEVVSFPALTRVPGAPPHLLGVFAHRGEVIPVVDLAILTGGKPVPSKRAVLLRVARGSVALTASKVAGVSSVAGSFDPLGSSGIQLHLKGPARAGREEVAVIEPEGLFEFLTQGG